MLRIFLSIIVLCLSSCSQNNHITEFNPPMWEECVDFKSHYDELNNRKIFYCNARVEFPADELVEFYKKVFQKMGLKKYSADGYGKGEWEKFNTKTGEWDQEFELPGRYIETWVDSDKTIRVVLSVRYDYDKSKKEGADWININISAQPFFEFDEG